MTQTLRQDREDRIEQATYALLAEKGYGSTSMLSIAKRAKCSNETLYNWYGDKVGLIRALVTNNAEQARALLDQALDANGSALDVLERFGPVLLGILLGDKAVALNRAAAADASGELGDKRTLVDAGVRLEGEIGWGLTTQLVAAVPVSDRNVDSDAIAEMEVDFQKETTPNDVVTVIATRPLTDDEEWHKMETGQWQLFQLGESIANGDS